MADPPAAATRPVLVLYASADEAFVRGYLLPALGAGSASAQMIDARDVASIALAELEQALADSGVVLAVITPAFLTDPWSRLSELLASDAAIESGRDVIPLVLEDCELPLHIEARVRLDYRARADWDSETQRLRDHLARPAPVEAPLACPYPGMRPFRAADARYFHGRDDEIEAVLGLLAAGEREIFLVGPSGSGKSSLIEAGVLPRLRAQPGIGELVIRAMRPGATPLAHLAECLEAGPAAAVDAAMIAAWSARHPSARLVLFVDQLEELFSQATAIEQDRFALTLRMLREDLRCVLVLALRADFYGALLESPLWAATAVGRRRHVDVPPLRGAALRAAIELPARALDVYFEPGLVDRVLADAAGEPGVLPLLQETLVQLWGHRRHRLLTLAAYEALGEGGHSGLAVAISSRADRCLGELAPAQVVIARRLLLRLVSFGEGRPNTRRRQTRAQLTAGESPGELDGVLRHLVAARLVTVTGDGRPGDRQVDLCHEALITAWPPFAAWVEARRTDEQRRRQIQASADEWIGRGRGASGLLDEGELASAVAWRRSDAARELGESAEVTQLIDASRAALDRARARARRWIAIAGASLLVFAAVTGTLAVIARHQAGVAEAARRTAETERATALAEKQNAVRRLGEQYRDAGRQAVVEGSFQRAIPYLVAARVHGIDDVGLRTLFHTASASAIAFTLGHAGFVSTVGFTADGTRIVTSSHDGTARVWDAATGAPLTPPLVHPAPVDHAIIHDGGDRGTRVATIARDRIVRIWDTSQPAQPAIALPAVGRGNAIAFSGDGTAVITASADHTARVWSVATGAPLGPPLPHSDVILFAELDFAGTRAVTVVSSGVTAGIWDVKTGRQLAPLTRDWTDPQLEATRAHEQLAASATFSRDGARVVSAGLDRTARIWDAATGKVVSPPLAHDDLVLYAVFSPDGQRVATVADDAGVRIWDVATGKQVVPPMVHPAAVVRIAYSRDGARLLVRCEDKVIRIWNTLDGTLATAIDLESILYDADLSPDGGRLVTATMDGVARVWDVRPMMRRRFATSDRAWDAAISPDGSRVVTTSSEGQLKIWSADGALEATLWARITAPALAFTPDGARLLVAAMSGQAVIVDVAAGHAHPPPREPGRRTEPGVAPEAAFVHMPSRSALSPDGRRYATVAGEHSATIWDIDTHEPIAPRLEHAALVNTIRFSPDNRHAITASNDGTARLWDASSGAPLDPPLQHPASHWVLSAIYSPDGSHIATTCSDNNVYLWNAATHQQRTVLRGHVGYIISAAFSPDGALLLTNSDDHSARLWDVALGKLAVPPLEHALRVESAAFAPDGKRLVTTSGKAAQVWDVRTGRPLSPPLVHPDYLRAAVFSSDGNLVLTTSRDGVRLWDVGLDTRSLEDWHRIVTTSSFPQLGDTLDRLTRPPSSSSQRTTAEPRQP